MCYCNHCIFFTLAAVYCNSEHVLTLLLFVPMVSAIKTPVPYKHKAKNVYEKVVLASMHQPQSRVVNRFGFGLSVSAS